jgi:hypothetical protein
MTSLPGSQHLEAVITAAVRWPSTHAGPPHGHPSRWDWSVTLRSLAEACMRTERLAKHAASMTEAERLEVWGDPSPEAARLRDVMRWAR